MSEQWEGSGREGGITSLLCTVCPFKLYPVLNPGLCHTVCVCMISFITGSYDRTCKVWDTQSGEELHTLEGHGNVVYAIAFNNPFGSALLVHSTHT